MQQSFNLLVDEKYKHLLNVYAKAYDNAALELFDKFAVLNFEE